ncbi:MAG: transporter substrate-binding domain-containing protein [Methanocalculus sp.]|uniref:cache domain-containing protein n=1 Tax=Methanocalculus sp. TaxID=2004547 RepID=UPI0027187C86|nr:transporter substrate-binding domain-containing protein [Methanocalculus sp.]MDO9540600.1 transporter substrate-binding domain-containing protein [Methanocalculus sp.]
MVKIHHVFLLCLTLFVVFAAGCTTPEENVVPSPIGVEELTFVTEEYPPFNYIEDGVVKGISVDILLGALEEMGTPVSGDQILVLPWHIAYDTALSEKNTVLLTIVRSPEREELFKWAGPFVSIAFVLFGDVHEGVTISTPDDLKKYRIGVVKDDYAGILLKENGVLESNIIEAEDVLTLISLIHDGTIDLFCYGDIAGRYFIEKATDDPDQFGIVYRFESYDLYFAFNRETPDSLVEAFQESLDTLRYQPDQTGVTEYQRILYSYIGVSYLPNPSVTREQVIDLVDRTADAIETDTPGTFARINAGEHPFWDRENRALYVFVYDTNVTIVAEADNPRLIGVNMRGKTDIAGTPFRDQITDSALTEGSGWVDYKWMIPEMNGIYHKSVYFKLTEGSDNNQYIVISGLYSANPNPAHDD